jgi:hypothetical protein
VPPALPTTVRGLPRAAAALLAFTLLLACRGGARQEPPGGSAHRYGVRGEVVRIAEGAGGPELWIRHEAIPEFVDQAGKVVGMHAMVMPFRARPDVAVAKLRAGDKIRFRLAVDWARNAFEIEAVEPLPAGAALQLGAPR